MPTRTYSTPIHFKAALEDRLRNLATREGVPFPRRRMLLIFERFLARVTISFDDLAVLKGGLALELRLSRARTTKDIDLRMRGAPDDLLSRLQTAGMLDHGDFMRFEIASNTDNPEIEGTIYDGFRFVARCMLGGRLYGDPFGIDIAFGDPLLGPPQELEAPHVLGFIGVAPTRVKIYPAETHAAEKLHAYTLDRGRPNSRVKDLPDLALLASGEPFIADRLRRALRQTFGFRGTHDVPASFPPPPREWSEPYAQLARNDGLRWTSLEQVTAAVQAFMNPVLTGASIDVWRPTEWDWTPAEANASQ